jgi:hypothetical protein
MSEFISALIYFRIFIYQNRWLSMKAVLKMTSSNVMLGETEYILLSRMFFKVKLLLSFLKLGYKVYWICIRHRIHFLFIHSKKYKYTNINLKYKLNNENLKWFIHFHSLKKSSAILFWLVIVILQVMGQTYTNSLKGSQCLFKLFVMFAFPIVL